MMGRDERIGRMADQLSDEMIGRIESWQTANDDLPPGEVNTALLMVLTYVSSVAIEYAARMGPPEVGAEKLRQEYCQAIKRILSQEIPKRRQ